MDGQHSKLAQAVMDAAKDFNHAVNRASDAGILVDVSVENEDPEFTLGSIPRQKVVVKIHQRGR